MCEKCGVTKCSRLTINKLLTHEELTAAILKDLETKFMVSVYCEDENGQEYEIEGLTFTPVDLSKVCPHDKKSIVSEEVQNDPSIDGKCAGYDLLIAEEEKDRRMGRDLSSEATR